MTWAVSGGAAAVRGHGLRSPTPHDTTTRCTAPLDMASKGRER